MAAVAVWHGTDGQLFALRTAVQHHCQCTPDYAYVCDAHRMLTDQYVLDHLAFVISHRQLYLQAEFDPVAEWW